jgi:uncharacterized protein YehS (DUF1456 family)
LELCGFISGKRGKTESTVMYTMVIRLINNVTVLWPRIKYKTSRDEIKKKKCIRLGIIGTPT